LRHAFEGLGCVRVQFKTDQRNERSQRVIERTGAVREGVLRNHMILPDGHLESSASALLFLRKCRPCPFIGEQGLDEDVDLRRSGDEGSLHRVGQVEELLGDQSLKAGISLR
jgi:hypothetical protein